MLDRTIYALLYRYFQIIVSMGVGDTYSVIYGIYIFTFMPVPVHYLLFYPFLFMFANKAILYVYKRLF